jgi:hypothetical protein
LHGYCVRKAAYEGIRPPEAGDEKRAAELEAIKAAVEAGKVKRLHPQRTWSDGDRRGRIQRSGRQYR